MYEIGPRQWRGRHITTRKDGSGHTHTAMTGGRALIFTPVAVEPGSAYRVHLELKRENGDGRLCCNLFANRNFDFQQVAFECKSSDWMLYNIILTTGDFPSNMPVVLRLWRPGGKGAVLVRRMAIEKAESEATVNGSSAAISKTGTQTAAAAKARPGTRKLGGQAPAPNPEVTKRETISRAMEKERAKKRAARRKLGAPRPRGPERQARAESRRAKPQRGPRISNFMNRGGSHRVLLVMGDPARMESREKAFSAAGFKVHAFCVNHEKGKGLEERIEGFEPEWIHICLEEPYWADSDVATIARRKAPTAVLSVWDARPSFAEGTGPLMESADFVLVGGVEAESAYRAAGLPASQWAEGGSDEERKKAVEKLASRIGFMGVLASKFEKERIEGNFERLLCFVPAGHPSLFGNEKNISGISMKFLPFVDCGDFEAKAIAHAPDWLHIHCDLRMRIPWKQAVQDLRRKLPRMLVTSWHPGGNTPDLAYLAMADAIDHMAVGAGVDAHRHLGMVHAFEWLFTHSPIDGVIFTRCMEAFASTLRSHRHSLLFDREGKRVDLTVFIGTYNRLEKLKDAVKHAFDSAKGRSVEVIVNDAGSTDGTIEWLKQRAAEEPRLALILSGRRTSFTQAFNESLRMAKGRYICWLSDDIMCQGGTLSEMCRLMDSRNPLDMGAFPIWNSWIPQHYDVRESQGYMCPTVGCMYTETLRRLNGLNLDYPYYSQDTEMDYRVMRLGGTIVECTSARLDHLCDMDELRKTNIQHHDSMGGGDKFEASSLALERSRHQYPAILLILKEGADAERAERAAASIRRHYSNSHIYLASRPRVPAGPALSMMRAPLPDSAGCARFDMVIELYPDRHILVSPAGKNDRPFIRSLVP